MESSTSMIGRVTRDFIIEERIGGGGYGTVYLASRTTTTGKKHCRAVKHIAFPTEDQYDEAMRQNSYNTAAVDNHFTEMIAKVESEVDILSELSRASNLNIVNYYDHEIVPTIDETDGYRRFDIFILMEYVPSLDKHVRQNRMSLGDIVRLGMNICDALTLCHENNVIHRDIKESNLFVTERGIFKLGDFGVAKNMLDGTSRMSIKGSWDYMAPELLRREEGDLTIDIYSLGIVLYRLLNHHRGPFLPDFPKEFWGDDNETAIIRRSTGEVPPRPAHAQDELGRIVVKACSPRGERYDKAGDMKKHLDDYLKSLTDDKRNAIVVTIAEDVIKPNSSQTIDVGIPTPPPPRNTHTNTPVVNPPPVKTSDFQVPKPVKRSSLERRKAIFIGAGVVLVTALTITTAVYYQTRGGNPPEATGLPAFMETITPSPTDTATPIEKTLPPTEVALTPIPIETPTPSGSPSPYPLYGKLTSSNLTIRDEPDSNGQELAKIQSGEEFYLLARIGNWYSVSYNGERGYASAGFIEEGTAAPQYPREGRITSSTLKLREAPEADSKEISTVSNGETLYLLERTGDWYKVFYNGANGYATANFINEGPATTIPSAPPPTALPTATPAVKFTVSFDTHTGTAVESIKVAYGTRISAGQFTTTREGHIFKGWFTDSSFTKQFTEGQVRGNMTLHAKWEVIKYTVTYNYGDVNPLKVQIKYNEKVTAPSKRAKDGVPPDSWVVTWMLDGKPYTFGKVITKDITLKAEWFRIATLSFNTTGGSKVSNVTITWSTLPGDKMPANPSKEGYTFGGWYEDSACTNKFNASAELMQHKTLYAKWNKAK